MRRSQDEILPSSEIPCPTISFFVPSFASLRASRIAWALGAGGIEKCRVTEWPPFVCLSGGMRVVELLSGSVVVVSRASSLLPDFDVLSRVNMDFLPFLAMRSLWAVFQFQSRTPLSRQ